MKKIFTIAIALFFISSMLTSCYVYTVNVGKGAQSNVTVKKWNHYLLDGLAPISVSDSKEMAGDATDYTVTTKISFINGLLTAITYGIYSPTTTIVTK
jgi:hypothetical protein